MQYIQKLIQFDNDDKESGDCADEDYGDDGNDDQLMMISS